MTEQTQPVEEIPKSLVEQILAEIDLQNHFVWGHGTGDKETAEKILREGIVVSQFYDLDSIIAPITSIEQSDQENAQKVVEVSSSWPHRESQYIILVSIPVGIRLNFVAEQVAIDGVTYNRIPTRFIPAYIDSQSKRLVPNPLFESNATPTLGLIPTTRDAQHAHKPISEVQIPIPNAMTDSSLSEPW